MSHEIPLNKEHFGPPDEQDKCRLKSQGRAERLKRAPLLSILGIPLVLFYFGIGTLDWASNVVHVLFGTMLLLYSLAKTFELAGKVKYWAVLPFALLVRQFFFVVLPLALTPHLQDQYRAGSWYFDSLFEGGLVLSIENYVCFFLLYRWIKRANLRTELKSDQGSMFWFCASVALMAIGIATKIALYYGFSEFPGQSATKFWFGLGLALLLVLLMEKNRGNPSGYLRAILAVGVACLVAIPLTRTGSRSLLLMPFFCLLGTLSCFRLERFTVNRVSAGVFVALILGALAFSIVAEVRSLHYMSGNVATLDEVRHSAKIDPTVGLDTAMYRLGSIAASAQVVVDSPALFPPRRISNAFALFAGSLISRNVWDVEQTLGISYRMGKLTPGEVMATHFGMEGAACFPLSCDLYLIGGYKAVALGAVLVAALTILLIRFLNGALGNSPILVALLAGVLFPGFSILETATELASLLLWSMWMLILLCVILRRMQAFMALTSKKALTPRTGPTGAEMASPGGPQAPS